MRFRLTVVRIFWATLFLWLAMLFLSLWLATFPAVKGNIFLAVGVSVLQYIPVVLCILALVHYHRRRAELGFMSVHFNLTPALTEQLTKFQHRIGAPSAVAAISHCMNITDSLVELNDKGYTLVLQDDVFTVIDDGVEVAMLPLLYRPPESTKNDIRRDTEDDQDAGHCQA